MMASLSQLFICVIWEKARAFEAEIRADIAARFKVVAETECFWPRRNFTKNLARFYGWNDWFCWWNKARKCGRGAFRVIVFEVANPHYDLHTNTFGREVCVELSVNDAKRKWRHLTGHHNRVHASLNAVETDLESQVLFGQSVRMWLAGHVNRPVPSAEDLEALLAAGNAERLGIGSRRSCYLIPRTDLCLKGYRSEAEIALGKRTDGRPFKPLESAVVREIRRHRFSDVENTSCQEWRYHQVLQRTLPPDLAAVFPEVLERMLVPSRGWCLVENVIRNADGSPVEKFHAAYLKAGDALLRSELLRRLRELEDSLVSYAVRFYDPQNVMVQWIGGGKFRLRIVDFEPASRTLVPLDMWLPWLVRLKVRRRFARYRRMMGW